MSGFQPRLGTPAPRPPRRPTKVAAAAAIAVAAAALFLVRGGGDSDAPAPQAHVAPSPPPAAVASAPYAVPVDDRVPETPETLEALTRSLAPAPRHAGGYVVSAADAELLAGTPLRAGDILLEIDGQKLSADRVKRLAEELGRFEDVWVSFERDGKRVETLLELK